MDGTTEQLHAEVALRERALAFELGLTDAEVEQLLALYRIEPDAVLDALGTRWCPTGLVARALMPNGGSGIKQRVRANHHRRIAGMLRTLTGEGRVEMRRISDSGEVLGRGDAGRGRNEWRRARS